MSSDRTLRYGVSAVAAFDVVSLALQLWRQAGERHEPALHAKLALLVASPVLLALLVACALLGLAAFALRRRPMLGGLAALVVLALLEGSSAALSFGHERRFFAVGAVLAGWLFGSAYAGALRRRAGGALPESYCDVLAESGALAGLAATYLDSSISKMATSGLGWADEATLRSAILVNHAVDDRSPLGLYAGLVVDHPALSQALSASTLVIQLGAVLLLVGPRLRRLWGGLILAFHANVALLTHIVYIEAIALVALFSFVPRRREEPGEVDPAAARSTAGQFAMAVAATVAGAWLLRLIT